MLAQSGIGVDSGELVGIFEQSASNALADCVGLVTDNLGWFLAIFTFFLAVRFGPALLSWFRHRNDPKQMNTV